MGRSAWLCGGIITWILASSCHADSTRSELYFGSIAMDIPAEMNRRLMPLTQYLSEKVGIPIYLKLSPNMPDAIENLVTARVDLAYLTPVAYINAKKKNNVRLVAKTITNGEGSFKLMIVVKQQSPVRTVADLKGRSFAFGDKAAILQAATVVDGGMPIETLGNVQYLGHYDNIARAVLHGDFDAGILKDTTALKYKGKGLRIIYSSPSLPPYNICASANIDKVTFEKLRKAFLALDQNKPAHKPIIKALDDKYDGFAAATDAEYDIVRKLIAPFGKNIKK